MGNTQLSFEYLAMCSPSALESLELSQLNQASNLRKELWQIMQRWIESEVQAKVARWLLESRRSPGVQVAPGSSRATLPETGELFGEDPDHAAAEAGSFVATQAAASAIPVRLLRQPQTNGPSVCAGDRDRLREAGARQSLDRRSQRAAGENLREPDSSHAVLARLSLQVDAADRDALLRVDAFERVVRRSRCHSNSICSVAGRRRNLTRTRGIRACALR
jgi:hypothetical protein